MRCGQLLWGEEAAGSLTVLPQVILGADLLYDPGDPVNMWLAFGRHVSFLYDVLLMSSTDTVLTLRKKCLLVFTWLVTTNAELHTVRACCLYRERQGAGKANGCAPEPASRQRQWAASVASRLPCNNTA